MIVHSIIIQEFSYTYLWKKKALGENTTDTFVPPYENTYSSIYSSKSKNIQ